MKKNPQSRETKPVTGLEKYPMNVRQAIYLFAGIVRRIETKRLDKESRERLIDTDSKGVVKNEDR